MACQSHLYELALHLCIRAYEQKSDDLSTAFSLLLDHLECTSIFDSSYMWQQFINYEGKANEMNISRMAGFFFLDLSQYVCAYAHAGEYVSQKIKINVAAMP